MFHSGLLGQLIKPLQRLSLARRPCTLANTSL
jgi:hypothetical protein